MSRNPPETDPAIQMLPVPQLVNVGDEVLAKFTDDGWYYRGESGTKS